MQIDIGKAKSRILFWFAFHFGKRGVSVEVKSGVVFVRYVYKFRGTIYLDKTVRFPWGGIMTGGKWSMN